VRRDRHSVEVGGAQPLHLAQGATPPEAEADGLSRGRHRKDPGLSLLLLTISLNKTNYLKVAGSRGVRMSNFTTTTRQ
jgi:hypothetical protein